MRARPILWRAAGLVLSVAPVTLCTLLYFPLWVERDVGAVLSGATLLLLAFSFLPMLRLWRERGKTPSAPLLWGILFLLFLALSRVAAEMTVISFWGFVGNALGEVCFRLSRGERHERT